MVSSEPLLARLENSTHLLDIRIPVLQAPVPSHSVRSTAGPLVSDLRTLVMPDPMAVHECMLDDINNRHTIRNEQRDEKWEHEENVSDDKTIMGIEDYIAMTVAPGRAASPSQGLPPKVVSPIPQLINLMTMVPSTPISMHLQMRMHGKMSKCCIVSRQLWMDMSRSRTGPLALG